MRNSIIVVDGDISIHAPVWGATTARSEKLEKFEISIHAPVWGATR